METVARSRKWERSPVSKHQVQSERWEWARADDEDVDSQI